MSKTKASKDSVVSKVEKWLEGSNNTIELKLTLSTPLDGLVEQNFHGRAEHGPSFAYSSTSEQGIKIYFLISFTKIISPSSTVEELRDALNFVTLDDIPLQGFEYPTGWSIRPQTPVSSFKEGVEIVSYENGRLHYKIDTRFFCIYGNCDETIIGSCNPPPAPNTFFCIERDIRGVIDVDMPLIFL